MSHEAGVAVCVCVPFVNCYLPIYQSIEFLPSQFVIIIYFSTSAFCSRAAESIARASANIGHVMSCHE